MREQTFATLAGQFDAHYPLVTIAENDGVGVVSAQPSAKFLVRSFPRQHDCDIEGEVEKQMGAGAKPALNRIAESNVGASAADDSR